MSFDKKVNAVLSERERHTLSEELLYYWICNNEWRFVIHDRKDMYVRRM